MTHEHRRQLADIAARMAHRRQIITRATFGRNEALVFWRLGQYGWTQPEIATAIGCNDSTICTTLCAAQIGWLPRSPRRDLPSDLAAELCRIQRDREALRQLAASGDPLRQHAGTVAPLSDEDAAILWRMVDDGVAFTVIGDMLGIGRQVYAVMRRCATRR